MISNAYFLIVKKKKRNREKQPKQLELLNPSLLKKMSILDSDKKKKIRLLFDFRDSLMFIAFDGRKNQAHYHESLTVVEAFYRKLFRAY